MGWFSRLRGRFTFHRWVSRNLEGLKALVRLRETAYRPEALQRFHALLAEAPPVPEVANFWQAIARWCQDADAYREAEQALCRAKAIYEQTVGLQHPDAWHVLDQLSLALFSLARFDEAQAAAEGSLAMKTTLWGARGSGLATPLNSLAAIAIKRGEWDAAKMHLNRALELMTSTAPSEQSPVMLAVTRSNLARICSLTGALEESAGHLQQALRHLAMSNEIGVGPLIDDMRADLAAVYRQQEKHDEAADLEAVRRRTGGHDPLPDLKLQGEALAAILPSAMERQSPSPLTALLGLEAESWVPIERSPTQETWQDPALDLACFGVCSTPAPWLGADDQSFHATVSDLVARTGGGLVDAERFLVAGRAAARVITKHPRQPHGMTYLGVLLIQDAAQVFAIRIGCTEQGATGYRDAVILHEQLAGIAAEQEAELALRRLPLYGQDHPMSVHSEQEGVRAVRNRSEDEEYDARFPAHPLSRARRMMRLFSQKFASLGS